MLNVAIKQGWAGGNWHTKEFVKALQSSGYSLTDSSQADIIIAHSTGCYDIPAKSPARFLMLIGPPYWPGKSIIVRLAQKKSIDTSQIIQAKGWKYFLTKTGWEIVYFFTKPRYTVLALQYHSTLDFLNDLKDKQILLVRNHEDYFCSPDVQVAVTSYQNVHYVSLPGIHDDYYLNPQPYIDLLPKQI